MRRYTIGLALPILALLSACGALPAPFDEVACALGAEVVDGAAEEVVETACLIEGLEEVEVPTVVILGE